MILHDVESPEVTKRDTGEMRLAEALSGLGSSDNRLAANPNMSLSHQYWLSIAPADELTDFIVRQPNHTWNGLTIYPEEAWRYRDNDLWIRWRGDAQANTRKVRRSKKVEDADWDDE